jgi:hypothetical protein
VPDWLRTEEARQSERQSARCSDKGAMRTKRLQLFRASITDEGGDEGSDTEEELLQAEAKERQAAISRMIDAQGERRSRSMGGSRRKSSSDGGRGDLGLIERGEHGKDSDRESGKESTGKHGRRPLCAGLKSSTEEEDDGTAENGFSPAVVVGDERG